MIVFTPQVKSLEKEISDIQSEFETERQDYLETIRKQDKNLKLLSQISEKLCGTLKKECNYRDLDAVKEQSVWMEDAQKYKLPDLIVPRTRLPPAGDFLKFISFINFNKKLIRTLLALRKQFI